MAHAAQKGMMRFGCLERVGVGGRKSVMGEAVSFFFSTSILARGCCCG